MGSWNNPAKKLTLYVGADILVSALSVVTFNLTNPNCARMSPAVCVRASRVEAACRSCAEGECVALERQAMTRDTSIPTTGSDESVYGPGTKYSPGAVADVGWGNASVGDRFPLKIAVPRFIDLASVKNYPGDDYALLDKTNLLFSTMLNARTGACRSQLGGRLPPTRPRFDTLLSILLASHKRMCRPNQVFCSVRRSLGTANLLVNRQTSLEKIVLTFSFF
jgi:hypothetical protein